MFSGYAKGIISTGYAAMHKEREIERKRHVVQIIGKYSSAEAKVVGISGLSS